MSRRILVITDLWGQQDAAWLKSYIKPLHAHAEVKLYDSRVLAGIDETLTTEDELHLAFVQGGLERAVSKLLSLETEPVEVLAFSIGGAIAWQAALRGLKMTHLYALSSTRLRKEVSRPSGKLYLSYGELDSYKPDDAWQVRMQLKSRIILGKGHSFYRESECARSVIERLTVIQSDDSDSLAPYESES